MDGENVNKCIMKEAERLDPKKQKLFKVVSLSSNTVIDRVNDLAEDIPRHIREKR